MKNINFLLNELKRLRRRLPSVGDLAVGENSQVTSCATDIRTEACKAWNGTLPLSSHDLQSFLQHNGITIKCDNVDELGAATQQHNVRAETRSDYIGCSKVFIDLWREAGYLGLDLPKQHWDELLCPILRESSTLPLLYQVLLYSVLLLHRRDDYLELLSTQISSLIPCGGLPELLTLARTLSSNLNRTHSTRLEVALMRRVHALALSLPSESMVEVLLSTANVRTNTFPWIDLLPLFLKRHLPRCGEDESYSVLHTALTTHNFRNEAKIRNILDHLILLSQLRIEKSLSGGKLRSSNCEHDELQNPHIVSSRRLSLTEHHASEFCTLISRDSFLQHIMLSSSQYRRYLLEYLLPVCFFGSPNLNEKFSNKMKESKRSKVKDIPAKHIIGVAKVLLLLHNALCSSNTTEMSHDNMSPYRSKTLLRYFAGEVGPELASRSPPYLRRELEHTFRIGN